MDRLCLLLICLTLICTFCCCVGGNTYRFALFWPHSGIAARAQAQFQGIFRDRLHEICRSRGAAPPTNLSVEFEELLVPPKPSYSQLRSYAQQLNRSSRNDLTFAGATSVDPETRLQLASLVAPRPLHWVDPPKLTDLAEYLFYIIRTMQRPDLALVRLGPEFLQDDGNIKETKQLVIVVGPPYKLSDVQWLVRRYKYGVQCFVVSLGNIFITSFNVLLTRVTTVLVLADRTTTKAFLDTGLDTSLWSPDYRWILYDSGLINHVKANLNPRNSRNITSVEFGPYDDFEEKYLETTNDVMLYDLLNIWTVFLANLTCGLPTSQLEIRGLTGQFNVTENYNYDRHDWQLLIYRNLLTDSRLVGKFSTNGQFNMTVPRPRSTEREAILEDYRKLNLSIFVVPGSQYVRYKDGMENRTDIPFKQRLEGMSFDLCMEVLANLGLTNFTIYVQEDLLYGAPDADGNWNGIVATLNDGGADLACVDLTPTSARGEVIDFTVPYLTTNMSILYKRNRTDATKEMFQFMFPLSTATWFYLIGAMLVVALVLAILHRISPNHQLFDLRYSLFFSFASLVQGIVGNPPDRPGGRIVVSAYWLFVLILLVAYVANYAAMRTLARLEVEITTVASLLDQTAYTYGTLAESSLSSTFKDSTFNEMRQVYASMRRFSNGLFVDTRVAQEAVKTGSYAVIFTTPTNFYWQQLICDTVITGNFESVDLAFGLPKRSDLRTLINAELLALSNKGRIKHLYDKYFIIPESAKTRCETHPLIGVIPSEPAGLAPRSGALTLNNTLGLLVINVFGCCLTLIAAAIERTFQTFIRKMADKNEESTQKRRRSTIAGLFGQESTA